MGGTYIRNFICNFISHRKKEEKMKLKKRNVFIGITSFLIVLFTMPLGHALMILMEHLMEPVTMHYATFFMGLIGLIMVITGVFAKGDTQQTLWGLFGGLLFWTGWIEFIYVYYAHRFGVQPLIVGNQTRISDHALFFRILDYVHVTLLIQYKKRMRFFQLSATGIFPQQQSTSRNASHDTPHLTGYFHGAESYFMDQLHGIAILL